MALKKHIQFSALPEGKTAKRILVIRLQATGDVVIMLPYLQSLRNKLPANTVIDLLVREECKDIPKHLSIFNKVYVLGGGRNTKFQLICFLFMLPKLWIKGYDVLLDLQNHRLSKVMRALLRIKIFSVFDRTSGKYAGDRYKDTINAIGLPKVEFEKLNTFIYPEEDALLRKFGLNKGLPYLVINPGGAFANRNWDLKNYVEFCRIWKQEVDPDARFLVLGINKVRQQVNYFKKELGESLIDLVGRTTQIEAMLLLKKAQLVISEDSGLLHMSYIVGTPSIGILGSTRNDWTNPNLPHTYYFNSSDLPCGNCMKEVCIHPEILCLTRIKPKEVMNEALKLLKLRC